MSTPDISTYATCRGCDAPMRAHRALAEFHPGTVKAGTNGQCYRCTYPPVSSRVTAKSQSIRGAVPAKASLEERAAAAARSLDAYFSQRRWRLEAERRRRQHATGRVQSGTMALGRVQFQG